MFSDLQAGKKILCKSPDDLPQVAELIAGFAGDSKVWLFKGDMGAGKTTLIKALCRYFGVTDTVTSPTFSLVNEYQNEKLESFYHFDFYRIADEEEAMDIGCEEYFYSGNLCFIEWPSRIPHLIPDNHLIIHIEVQQDQSRSIGLHKQYE